MATRDTSILTRTMFLDVRNKRVRIHDFCVVETSLGTMLEPFPLMPLYGGGGFKKEDDPLALVDDFKILDGRQKFQVQNPHLWGTSDWQCLHDLQLFQRTQGYTQFGKNFEGTVV